MRIPFIALLEVLVFLVIPYWATPYLSSRSPGPHLPVGPAAVTAPARIEALYPVTQTHCSDKGNECRETITYTAEGSFTDAAGNRQRFRETGLVLGAYAVLKHGPAPLVRYSPANPGAARILAIPRTEIDPGIFLMLASAMALNVLLIYQRLFRRRKEAPAPAYEPEKAKERRFRIAMVVFGMFLPFGMSALMAPTLLQLDGIERLRYGPEGGRAEGRVLAVERAAHQECDYPRNRREDRRCRTVHACAVTYTYADTHNTAYYGGGTMTEGECLRHWPGQAVPVRYWQRNPTYSRIATDPERFAEPGGAPRYLIALLAFVSFELWVAAAGWVLRRLRGW